jgi:hypothetical protein
MNILQSIISVKNALEAAIEFDIQHMADADTKDIPDKF